MEMADAVVKSSCFKWSTGEHFLLDILNIDIYTSIDELSSMTAPYARLFSDSESRALRLVVRLAQSFAALLCSSTTARWGLQENCCGSRDRRTSQGQDFCSYGRQNARDVNVAWLILKYKCPLDTLSFII